ncbi:hypothetical protein IWW43_006574, partial [Coemansia sp. RSA 1935]
MAVSIRFLRQEQLPNDVFGGKPRERLRVSTSSPDKKAEKKSKKKRAETRDNAEAAELSAKKIKLADAAVPSTSGFTMGVGNNQALDEASKPASSSENAGASKPASMMNIPAPTNFYYNPDHKTNDDIWAYEAMEAFIAKGSDDPQTYLEYEVGPNNVTFNAFIYNPSRVRREGAPMDQAFISDPLGDGFKAVTRLNKLAGTWTTESQIPLAL